MLFDAKRMRIPLKFHIYSVCNVRFKCFRFQVRHFDFRLNSHRIVHRAMLLSAAVTSASSKINAATLNFLPKVIHTLWFNGHQVFYIFINKSSSPPSLLVTIFDNGLNYLENLNVIPSRVDGSRNRPKRNGTFERATEKRPLAEDWRQRHIRLAIKPRYIRNHASQIKSYIERSQEVMVALSEPFIKRCMQRPLVEKSRWRHIQLALQPSYHWNHAWQLKSFYGLLSWSLGGLVIFY